MRSHITASITDALHPSPRSIPYLTRSRGSVIPILLKEDAMTGAEVSHIILWVILGMTVLGAVSSVGALFMLGRGSYKKN